MKNLIKLAGCCMVAFASANSYAMLDDYIASASKTLSTYTLDCSHWYVAGNIGVSDVYDDETEGTNNSMDRLGPGWDAAFGYQLNSLLGAELGYTQYANSRETSNPTVVAQTSHYAVHLNATGRYPLMYNISAIGKLGIAYAHAFKVYEVSGAGGTGSSVSPFLGFGFDYSITPRTDMLLQWQFVRGNDFTGSNVLYSVGFAFAIV